MCWFVPLIIAGVSAVAQMQANDENTEAAVKAANFNAAEAARQAQIAEMRARNAIDRGEAEREGYMRQAAQDRGGLAAQFGASGMDVNSGSSADLLADSAGLAYLGGKNIRHNASMEAWGYKEDARNARVQSQLSNLQAADAGKAGRRNKTSTLLNTAGSMAGGLANMPTSTPGGASSLEYKGSKGK